MHFLHKDLHRERDLLSPEQVRGFCCHQWTCYLIIFVSVHLVPPLPCWGCKVEIQHIPHAVTSGIINSIKNGIWGFRFLLVRQKQAPNSPFSPPAQLGRKINDINSGFSRGSCHPAWFPSSSSAFPQDGLLTGEDRSRKERISTELNYFQLEK